MESVNIWTRSSTKDFCLYSLLRYGISEEMYQEFHRGLLLLFFTKTVHSVWNQ
jgi:hypothetical protein